MKQNASIAAAACFEANKRAKAMFHLNNIIDIARDLRSNANTQRLDLRDKRSASAIRKHISGTEIVTPAMKEIRRRNSFTGYSNNYNSLIGQLGQALQRVIDNTHVYPQVSSRTLLGRESEVCRISRYKRKI
jgi:endoglucanase Acf2